MDKTSILLPTSIGIQKVREFSNARETPLKHGPVEENDARLSQANVPCAAWSQGTIGVSAQGIVYSNRQLDSYPVLNIFDVGVCMVTMTNLF